MVVIFTASSDIGSARNTSRFIGPFLRWFKPNVTDQTIRGVQAVVRKSAHIAEYGVLALLCLRGRRAWRGGSREWSWPDFGWILAFCILYAISDEYHQSFVSSRYSSPYDVLFDTAGAAAALLSIRALDSRVRKVERTWLETKGNQLH